MAIHPAQIIAILDANILYPAPLRDYLLHLANLDLYKPKWTDEIQKEWIDNLLLKRDDLTRNKLAKTKDAMNSAFPDANVTDYEGIIAALSLKDADDRHVLAAAIRVKANVVVTFNLKDFPQNYLQTFGVKSQYPDAFVLNLIKLDKISAMEALDNQGKSLKNPPKSKAEVLEILKQCGLKQSVLLLE